MQLHVDPPPTPLIKIKHDDNSDKDFVNIKLRMDKTSEKLELYELKMALFENDKPEDFLICLLFQHDFQFSRNTSDCRKYPIPLYAC